MDCMQSISPSVCPHKHHNMHGCVATFIVISAIGCCCGVRTVGSRSLGGPGSSMQWRAGEAA
eukprot:883128-Alexandrium_andersonii.AAC.1